MNKKYFFGNPIFFFSRFSKHVLGTIQSASCCECGWTEVISNQTTDNFCWFGFSCGGTGHFGEMCDIYIIMNSFYETEFIYMSVYLHTVHGGREWIHSRHSLSCVVLHIYSVFTSRCTCILVTEGESRAIAPVLSFSGAKVSLVVTLCSKVISELTCYVFKPFQNLPGSSEHALAHSPVCACVCVFVCLRVCVPTCVCVRACVCV